MLVNVQTLTKEIFTFPNVQPSQIIETVSEQLGDAIKCSDVRLIYGTKQLRQDVPFEYYKIPDGATLLCVTPLGGSARNFNPGEKLLRDAKDVENQECAICFEELGQARTAMAIPCKHFEFCSECLAKLNKCPLCRGLITATVSNA